MRESSRRLVLVFSVFLLILPGMSGCAKTKNQVGKWWESNVGNPITRERRLVITSNPPQADVFINEVYQGKTPLRLKFKVGLRDIFKGLTVSAQKKDYLPARRSISFRTERITFRLIKKKK